MIFIKETEFKDTEVGKIPKDWEVRRLSEIAEFSRGFSYRKGEKFDEPVEDGYLFLTLNSIKEGGGLKEDGWSWIKSNRLSDRVFVKEGDIVIANTEQSKDGTLIGSPAIVHFPKWYRKGKAVYSMDLSKLILKVNNIDTNYLFYYLSFVQPLARRYHSGTNVWHLNIDSWARALLIPIPPLEEQHRIVSILTAVDEAIAKVNTIIYKAERLRKALLNHLMTRGIGHKEYKETEIGKIPKEWNIVKFKDIALDIYYGLTAEATDDMTNLRLLRTTDIKDHKVNWDALPYAVITEKNRTNINRYLLKKNDLIISRAGTVGVAILVPRDFDDVIFGSYLIKVKVNEKLVYPQYIYYYCRSDTYWIQIGTGQAGSTLKNINLRVLSNVKIPLPPIDEQRKIAEILSTIDRYIDSLRNRLDRLRRVKSSLMDILLTGKIRLIHKLL